MQHAKTFVKVPSSARLPTAQVSGVRTPASATAADAPALIPDSRPFPPDPSPPPPGPDERACPELAEREVDRLDDAMRCPDRRRVLQTLCAAGRATGTTLSRVLRLTDKATSRHLRDLHLLHLVHRRREGQRVWYQCDPTRVHSGRDDKGRDVLTLSHPSGAEVTRRVPATPPAPTAEPTGARTETGDAE